MPSSRGATGPANCEHRAVVLDRIAVMPGHYVFADSSGAVVIPDVQIEEVLAEARKVEAADAAVHEQIRDKRNIGGKTTP